MDTTHTCTACGATVTEAEAFVRSVNLMSVAWCRPCWFAKNTHLPQQRTVAAMKEEPRRRRWLLRRRVASYDEAGRG